MPPKLFYVPRWYAPDAGDGGGTPPEDDDKSPSAPRTFTQADVDALMGKTRKDARETAINGLLKELEIGSMDDLKTFFSEAKTLKDAQLSEAEKQKNALADAERKIKETETNAQTVLRQANERLMRAAVLAEAMKPDYNLPPSAGQDVWLFVKSEQLDTLTLTDAGEVEGVAKALTAVLKDRTYLQGKAHGTPLRENHRRPAGPEKDTRQRTVTKL